MNTQSMAEFAKKDESETANLLNIHFENKGLPYVARDNGASGHDNDVLVEHKITKEPINDIETKRSGGSRTDFGQFKVYYDAEDGWLFHESTRSKPSPVAKHVFEIIKPQIDEAVRGDFLTGPNFDAAGAAHFWSIHEPSRVRSICGDIIKIPIPVKVIPDYYINKGNDYIKIGKNLYSLTSGNIPTLESKIKECYAQFRIKYHSPRYSYTVALRLKCESDEETEFFTALNKIY
jgi:hypothetical protein